MTQGARGARRARRWLILAGAALIVLGVGDAIRIRVTHPEKPAYYVLGHWFEALWQVEVPLIALGIAALVIAWLLDTR